jgi:hypothetical protein
LNLPKFAVFGHSLAMQRLNRYGKVISNVRRCKITQLATSGAFCAEATKANECLEICWKCGLCSNQAKNSKKIPEFSGDS